MPVKYWLPVAVLAIAAIGYYALNPLPQPRLDTEIEDAVKTAAAERAALEEERRRQAEEIDRKLAEMQPRYDQLDATRKELNALHDRLTRRFRRQTAPAEIVPRITKDMSDAAYLMRNPRQIGAFKDAAEIDADLAAHRAALEKLEEINRLVPEVR